MTERLRIGISSDAKTHTMKKPSEVLIPNFVEASRDVVGYGFDPSSTCNGLYLLPGALAGLAMVPLGTRIARRNESSCSPSSTARSSRGASTAAATRPQRSNRPKHRTTKLLARF